MQREVIKWAQSLDLSYPIKNPRKDLANGFLVAEILSRYDKDVSMHSFGTELAMHQRLNNWQQITKILERMQCGSITKELVEGTVQQKGLIARDLLDQLYMFLTKRQLKPNTMAPPVKTLLESNGFARPTAAALLREANDATKLRLQDATGQVDESKIRNTNESILKRHSITLQSLKLAEPDRYQPKRPTSYASIAAESSASRSRGHHATPATHRERTKPSVKDVEVRAVDDSILSTFAQRDQRAKDEALRSGFSRDDDLSTAMSRVLHKPLAAFGLIQDLDALYPQAQEGAEYFQKFIMLRQRIPIQVRSQCWSAIHDSARSIAKHIVLRNDEAMHLMVQLSFAFGKDTALLSRVTPVARDAMEDEIGDGDPAAAVFDAEHAFALLCTVGKQLVAVSPEVASRVLDKHLIAAVTPLLLHGTASVIECVACVLTSFVHHHHLDGIRRLVTSIESALKEQHDARDRFLLATAHVLRAIDFSSCHGIEVIARFYAAEGFGATTVLGRGAAIMMALQSVETNPLEGAVFMSTIANTITERSWELRLAALEFLLVYHRVVTREEASGGSSSRRRSVAAGGSNDAEEQVAAQQRDTVLLERLAEDLPNVRQTIVKFVSSFDGARASSSQRMAALIVAAKYLDNDVGSIDDIGFDLMPRIAQAATASRDATALLHGQDGGDDAVIVGRVRSSYPIAGFQRRWSSVSIAQTLGTMLEQSACNDLSTLAIVQLIEALVLGVPHLGEDASGSVWETFLQQAKEVLVIAASNPGQCRGVAQNLMAACADTARNAIAKLFVDLSGDVPRDEASLNLQELHGRALEWLQSFEPY